MHLYMCKCTNIYMCKDLPAVQSIVMVTTRTTWTTERRATANGGL